MYARGLSKGNLNLLRHFRGNVRIEFYDPLRLCRMDATHVQNRVLSHIQFAERFYVNTIYCEQFHESIWSRLEERLSS